MFILLLLGLVGLSLYAISLYFKSKPIPSHLKRLPFEPGLPIFGNLFDAKKNIYRYLCQLGKKFGGIFILKMMHRDIVILNDIDILNKALKEQSNIFSGRPQNVITKFIFRDSGIMFQDGELWATQRSFLLRVLRDFGFGKQRSNEIIAEERDSMLENLSHSSGEVVSCRYLFPEYMVNIISRISMSVRYNRQDAEFTKMTTVIENIVQVSNIFIELLQLFPVLRHYPRLAHFLIYLTGIDRDSELLHNYLVKEIDNHRAIFRPEMEPEDVIDIYLKEQHLQTENQPNHFEGTLPHEPDLNANNSSSGFSDWQLIRVLTELFVAGYETTSTTLSWAMLLLARHPQVQERVHCEIEHVIGGTACKTTTDHQRQMPYTRAVIDEVLRFSSVVPLALPHRVVSHDTEIDGFFIPRDSIVFPNLYAIHHDSRKWARPDDFYPEHFLVTEHSASSEPEWRYEAREDLVPFGLGKRQCLAESLARMEIFMFLTGIIQRFKLALPAHINEKEYQKMIMGTDGIFRAPVGSDVIFTERE